MLLFENISLAISALKANKSRAALTMLGIIIGIASVITIMTVGDSMSKAMSEQMSSRGATSITVGVTQKDDPFGMMGSFFGFSDNQKTLHDDDFLDELKLSKLEEKFSDRIEGVALTENVGNGVINVGDSYANVGIKGLNECGSRAEDIELLSGRSFISQDFKDGRKVCLVSDYYCDNLCKGDVKAPIGKQIVVSCNNKFYTYTVVGVYEYDSSMPTFNQSKYDISTTLYIPYEAAIKQTHSHKKFQSVAVVAKNVEDVTDLSDDIKEFLNSKFYRNNDDFEIDCFSEQSFIESFNSSMKMVSVAISVIAGISLLVGGIGVMNIMLVSITERTREIGTRKALGATNASIRTQFVVEAIVLCFIGGTIGIILGLAAGLLVARLMNYGGTAPVGSIVFSFVFSLAIGIFFGYYPANKAAKMNPIDALRYE